MPETVFDNYTMVGDIGVIALCFVIIILLLTSYVSRTRSLKMFMNIIVSLIAAAVINIVYHFLLGKGDPDISTLIYVLRIAYQALLFDVLFLFALYATEVSGLEHRKARLVALVSVGLLFVILATDIIMTIAGVGFKMNADGTVEEKTNIFMIGYVLFILILIGLMTRVLKLVYRRIMYGFYGIMIISVGLRFAQLIMNKSSLTTMTCIFPVIAMLYILHSNPYNVTLGTVDMHALEGMVASMYSRGEKFVFLSLLLPEYDTEGKKIPTEIQTIIRRFTANYFKKCVLFQIGNGHIVLVAPKKRNPDFEERIVRILAGFDEQYARFRSPYKIVIGESISEISKKNEYISLIVSTERSMKENTVRRLDADDIDRFNMDEYIISELMDISKKKDLDDPRVIVYCQPVYNIKTGVFDTAESLMRLELAETGFIPPEKFVPLAESYGFVHVLTEIILNKTCRRVKELMAEGYEFSRLSVNVSVLELKDVEFCDDISKIIAANGIPGEKIALELTESRCEADFVIMKEKIEELHRQGIQFYLDDFGTGYSNMERIMELPFDIIKFDRSMVFASRMGERSGKIVKNLANMFKDMNYDILYEGVEDEADEKRCREMSASYLQGYKYSRPVPIDCLVDFLPKKEN